jgi:hypothetical protein
MQFTEREQATENRNDPSLQEVVRIADNEMNENAALLIYNNTHWDFGRCKVICHFLRLKTFEDLGDLNARITGAPGKLNLTEKELKMLRAVGRICGSRDAYLNFVVRAHFQKRRGEYMDKQRAATRTEAVDAIFETNILSILLGKLHELRER